MSAAPMIHHRGRWALLAVATMAAAYVVALQVPVPSWELRLTTWLNDAPDAVASVLYPVMQLGTVIAPLGAAIVVLVWLRDRLFAAAVASAGLAAWFGAKLVKRVVQRGRPLEYLPDLHVREGSGTGLGFISGHSAVAATTAVMVVALVPRRWRWVGALVAGLVGIARVVHGVHLPADVVGGWAFGVLAALAALEVVALVRHRKEGVG